MVIKGEQKTYLTIIYPVVIELMLTQNEEVILIVIVCSNILFAKAVIANSPVTEFKFIIEELDCEINPVES